MNKFTKLFVVVLTLALLVGAVVGISAYAEGESEVTYEEKDLIISYNVSYADYMHLYLAIDTTLAEDYTGITADVTVNGETYTGIAIDQANANQEIYDDVTGHVLHTPGVAAKDMLDDITVTVYYTGTVTEGEGEEAATTTVNYKDEVTYSVAQYFFERLYKNGAVEATSGKALSQKQLYVAALNYGAAAQNLLSSADETKISDIVYLTSPSYTGMVEKGHELTLDASNYEFTYYNINGATGESDITGATGSYLINQTTVVKPLVAPVSGPDGSANFETLTPSDTDLGPTKKAYAAIAGANDGAYGIASIGGWSEGHARQFITVGYDGSNFIRHEVTEQDSTTSHTMEFIRDTSTEGDVLVFQARVRISFQSGYTQNRFYKGRFADGSTSTGTGLLGSGSANNLETQNRGFNGTGWYTYRVVAILNDDGTATIKGYRGADASSLGTTPVFTKTATVSSLSDITTFTMMLNTGCKGYIDYDYVYFNTVADLDAVNELTETAGTFDVTLAPDFVRYTDALGTAAAAGANANILNKSQSSFKGNLVIKSENGNDYVSLIDSENEYKAETNPGGDQGQAIIRLQKTTDTVNTIVFQGKFRISALADGTIFGGANGPTLRLQYYPDGTDMSKATDMNSRIYFTHENGKVGLMLGSDAGDGKVISNAGLEEWFTVKYEYTYTPAVEEVVDEVSGEVTTEAVAASAKMTITITPSEGEAVSAEVPVSVVDVAGMNIQVSIVPSKSNQSILDFDDISFN